MHVCVYQPKLNRALSLRQLCRKIGSAHCIRKKDTVGKQTVHFEYMSKKNTVAVVKISVLRVRDVK